MHASRLCDAISVEVFAACSAQLTWSNGRIPGAGAGGPPIVYFNGKGFCAVRTDGKLRTCKVEESASFSVRMEHLVGWTSDVVPQCEEHAGVGSIVGFTGAGMVLLSLGDDRGP